MDGINQQQEARQNMMQFASSAMLIIATTVVAVILATMPTLNALVVLVPVALIALFVGVSAGERKEIAHQEEDNWRHW
ncbi:MAG: hypothetical protein HY827_07280 [Actinobacteria bacterium]|nr:hypothetical protein [Actinomycetota bacterium]